MLFDFPGGFSRAGGRLDDDLLDRISRIATVGRRAGVFVFVVTDNPTTIFETLPWLPDNGMPKYDDKGAQPPKAIQSIGIEQELHFDWTFKPFSTPSAELLNDMLQNPLHPPTPRRLTQLPDSSPLVLWQYLGSKKPGGSGHRQLTSRPSLDAWAPTM